MNALTYLPIAVILLCFGATMSLTGWARRLLLKHNIMDQPNARSSHNVAVPRGGGWAFIPILLLGLIAPAAIPALAPTHWGLLAGFVLLAAISWLDDRYDLSARLRLLLHFIAVACALSDLPNHGIVFAGVLPAWLDHLVVLFGFVWFVNLYNFMDGIDGITCVETICIATGLCLLGDAVGLMLPSIHLLLLLLIGSALGFLAYNWHPARIFMGDIGSVPLGYLTGFALLSLACQGHLIAALILPLYYLADSGITITKRALRREKIWQAHRQHFYQHAAAGCGRHDSVVLRILTTNITLIGLALLSLTNPFYALAGAVIMVALLLLWMHKK